MDSKDSVNAVTREGGGPLAAGASTEDDGVLSVASSLGKEATGLFQSRKYAECVDVLRQLLEKNPDDVKVLHNIAIAEFFKEGCANPKKLLEALTNAKKRCEDLAHESGEQEDATSHTGDKALSVLKGNNQMPTSGGESMVYIDESDASLATLNMGIIYFILHRYSIARSILEPLFRNIEPLDERTVLCVCILLLDVATATQDVSIFADVVKHLKRSFDVGYMFNYSDTGNMGQQQPSDLIFKYSSVTENVSNSDDLNSEVPGTRSTSEDSLSRTLSEETMEYETLLSALDVGGKNISRSSKFHSSYALSKSPDEHTSFPIDLMLMLPLYGIQLLLLTRSLKAAKREFNLAMNNVRMRDSFRVLILKSQLEYACGNYTEAKELLDASKNQTEVESSIISNNYGCIFYQQGNHHTSGIFFQQALTSCSVLRKEKPKSITSFSQDKRSLIVYNCGVQHLTCGKPMLAASCFQAANPVFHNRPLLWLRLAECCLMALGKGASKSSMHVPHGSEVKFHVVGQGKWRYLAINNGFSRNDQKLSESDGEMHPSYGKPKLSLSYARQCLKNAHHLLSFLQFNNVKSGFTPKPNQEKSEQSDGPSPRYSNHETIGGSDLKAASKEIMSSGLVNSSIKDQRDGSSVSQGTVFSISNYQEILRRESQMIMQAVLVDLAFVELELQNPLRALSTALSLLDLPECSKMHAFLGHIYAAEALCYLNRTKEAAEHLSVYVGGGHKVDLPYTTEDFEQWQVKKSVDAEDVNMASKTASDEADIFLKPDEAKGALYTNLAAMFSMQGDLEQASRFANLALAIIPDSLEAVLMVVYLDLKHGRTEAAVAKLKLCKRVCFWRSDLKS